MSSAVAATPRTPPDGGYPRLVQVMLNNNAINAQAKFPDNTIVSSKYTILTFLPLFLFYQFQRLSNIFFLITAIITFIPGASALGPMASVFPIAFVLSVGSIREIWEDYKRHQADDAANRKGVLVLRDGKWVEIESRHLLAGEIVKYQTTDEVRADCIVLASSNEDGVAYVETANLDGETNIKLKRASKFTTTHLSSEEAIQNITATLGVRVSTPPPDPSLNSWRGVLEIGGFGDVLRHVSVPGSKGMPPAVVNDPTRDAQPAKAPNLGEDRMPTSAEMVTNPLEYQNFLVRGSIVRNTEWVICGTVFTGVNTKLFLNLERPPQVFSDLDLILNKLVIFVFVLHEVCIFVLCGLGLAWAHTSPADGWYLSMFSKEDLDRPAVFFFMRYLGYFVLLSFMLPASLFVTVELIKVFQAMFMAFDHGMGMYDVASGQWRFCRPKTSNLNEQLAMVRFIFTDKTGTLTQNKMNLVAAYAGGKDYNDADTVGAMGHDMVADIAGDPKWVVNFAGHARHLFLLNMSLCHSVVCFANPNLKHSDIKLYEGPSPDELALVSSARRNGYALFNRTSKALELHVFGRPCSYEILAECEFTPERKMMSMLVRDTEVGRNILFIKGADSSMFRFCERNAHNETMRAELEPRLKEMSVLGLRTLVLGCRLLSDAEAKAWLDAYRAASIAMDKRQELIEAATAAIERDFMLLGATGVEDKLQDGVPHTLNFLTAAGITIFMLTGDKRETAVSISETSGLVDPVDDWVHHIDVSAQAMAADGAVDDAVWTVCKNQLIVAQNKLRDTPKTRLVLVIDGATLDVVLEHDAELFMNVAARARSAVCCRLSPLQKAKIVRMFQVLTGQTVLAIGDGANDVSMIREGKVGVGIMGLEGAQAELASDYAIPQFRALKRLLVVHGRYSWYRTTTCINVCLFKNTALAICIIMYSFWSGFSGATIFDSWLLTMYNTFFTQLPPMVVGIFDRDAHEHLLLEDASLYGEVRDTHEYFNLRSSVGWFVDSLLTGVGAFLFVYTSMVQDDIDPRRRGGLDQYGTQIFVVLIFVVNCICLLTVRHWEYTGILMTVITWAAVPGFLYLYSTLGVSSDFAFSGTPAQVLSSAMTWAWVVVIVSAIVIVYRLSRRFWTSTLIPTATERGVLTYDRTRSDVTRALNTNTNAVAGPASAAAVAGPGVSAVSVVDGAGALCAVSPASGPVAQVPVVAQFPPEIAKQVAAAPVPVTTGALVPPAATAPVPAAAVPIAADASLSVASPVGGTFAGAAGGSVAFDSITTPPPAAAAAALQPLETSTVEHDAKARAPTTIFA